MFTITVRLDTRVLELQGLEAPPVLQVGMELLELRAALKVRYKINSYTNNKSSKLGLYLNF